MLGALVQGGNAKPATFLKLAGVSSLRLPVRDFKFLSKQTADLNNINNDNNFKLNDASQTRRTLAKKKKKKRMWDLDAS